MKKILRLGSIQVSLFIFLLGFVFSSGVSFGQSGKPTLYTKPDHCPPCRALEAQLDSGPNPDWKSFINISRGSPVNYVPYLVDSSGQPVNGDKAAFINSYISQVKGSTRPPVRPPIPAPTPQPPATPPPATAPTGPVPKWYPFDERSNLDEKVATMNGEINKELLNPVDIKILEVYSPRYARPDGRYSLRVQKIKVQITYSDGNTKELIIDTPNSGSIDVIVSVMRAGLLRDLNETPPPVVLPPPGFVPGPEPYESTLTTPLSFEKFRESKSLKLTNTINDGLTDTLKQFPLYHLNADIKVLISLSSDQTVMRIKVGICDGDQCFTLPLDIPWSPILSERPNKNGVRRLVAIRLAEFIEEQERLKKARPKPDKTKLVPVQRLPITPNELQDYVRRHLKDQ